MKRVLMPVVVLAMLIVPGVAFGGQSRQTAPAPAAKPAAAEPRPQPQPAARPDPTANIRVDLTITDQRGEGTALTKTMTVTVVDQGIGRIRTNGEVRTPIGNRNVILNVDVQPKIMKDGKVRIDLSIEYRPVAAEAETEKSATPALNEMIGVLLEDGKALLVSQSADPASDRRVKVDVKATILR